MQSKENPEEFYSRFHEQLLDSQAWPGKYMFKFIVRNGQSKVRDLQQLFDQTDAVFKEKASSKNKFLSLTVQVTMTDPDAVIAVYKQVQQMEGVITL